MDRIAASWSSAPRNLKDLCQEDRELYFKQERIHEEEILKCVNDGISYPETLNVIEDILHAEGQKLKSLTALYYKGIILMEMD